MKVFLDTNVLAAGFATRGAGFTRAALMRCLGLDDKQGSLAAPLFLAYESLECIPKVGVGLKAVLNRPHTRRTFRPAFTADPFDQNAHAPFRCTD
jgi:hypothetical protein